MKKILKLLLLCSLFFIRYIVVAQAPCTQSLVPPVTLPNGITVTSTSIGSVSTYSDPIPMTSCGNVTTPINPVWLGEFGAFEYTLNFNIPVNNIQINLTATGELLNEDFTFTTNAGLPRIDFASSNHCFSTISGNIIYSGLNSLSEDGGGGGEFIISAPANFTAITITGTGQQFGSLMSVCQNSILCPYNLTLISSADNVNNSFLPIGIREREAQNSIIATNSILFGNSSIGSGVVYHAGNSVELNPGFEAVFGSQFSAYIAGCTSNFVYRPLNTTVRSISGINPVHNINSPIIFPNPATDVVNILFANSKLNQVIVYSIDGRRLFSRIYENSDRLSLDVSGYAKGIYIIKIIPSEGQSVSKKLIKN